jgi:hypothetical protein
LDVPGNPPTTHIYEQIPDRGDQQEQTQGVADKARNTDQCSTGKHDHPIEQFPGRNFAVSEPVSGTGKHAETHSLDQKRAEGANSN